MSWSSHLPSPPGGCALAPRCCAPRRCLSPPLHACMHERKHVSDVFFFRVCYCWIRVEGGDRHCTWPAYSHMTCWQFQCCFHKGRMYAWGASPHLSTLGLRAPPALRSNSNLGAEACRGNSCGERRAPRHTSRCMGRHGAGGQESASTR